MKVKVFIQRTMEVEVDNPVIEELDIFWRTNDHPIPEFANPNLEKMVDETTKAVEEVVGIPFGNDEATETIFAVCAMDGEPIIEW